MMIGPQIQKAVFEALMAAPPLCDGRIYDAVPSKPKFPYATLGDENLIEDGNACGDEWDAFPTIHIWSRKPGHVEAKQIMSAAAGRILAIPTIEDFTLIAIASESARVFTDPDGLTAHGVLSFRFITTA